MPDDHEAYLTHERRERAAELDRETARDDQPTQPRRNWLARLFDHGNMPWLARPAGRRSDVPRTTAEILRSKRGDDR